VTRQSNTQSKKLKKNFVFFGFLVFVFVFVVFSGFVVL